MTPRQRMDSFVAKYQDEPIKVIYTWTMYPTNPYAKDGVVYIDQNKLQSMKHYEAMILKHEACHVMGLGHCEKKRCLMYWSFNVWLINFGDKKLCNECESLL